MGLLPLTVSASRSASWGKPAARSKLSASKWQNCQPWRINPSLALSVRKGRFATLPTEGGYGKCRYYWDEEFYAIINFGWVLVQAQGTGINWRKESWANGAILLGNTVVFDIPSWNESRRKTEKRALNQKLSYGNAAACLEMEVPG